MGYHPEIILAGRRINDMMGKYVAENTVKQLIKADKQIKGARVLIMGLTFKEDVPDTRNTKVVDIVRELREYGIEVFVSDYMADREEVYNEYGIELVEYGEVSNVDAISTGGMPQAVQGNNLDMLMDKYSEGTKVLIDVKGMYPPKDAIAKGFLYWSL